MDKLEFARWMCVVLVVVGIVWNYRESREMLILKKEFSRVRKLNNQKRANIVLAAMRKSKIEQRISNRFMWWMVFIFACVSIVELLAYQGCFR